MLNNPAVVARRNEPPDSLDYFPTPPWATRALVAWMRGRKWLMDDDLIWEPACGEGHMAVVLNETNPVYASDVFSYGYGAVQDFLAPCPTTVDWVITNPPFNLAEMFALLGNSRARKGVALLVRLSWLESEKRYKLFKDIPPSDVLIHSGRVPMHKGRWEVDGKSATAYAWVIWRKDDPEPGNPRLGWIRPDAKRAYSKPDDALRFGAKTPAPLLDGVALDYVALAESGGA